MVSTYETIYNGSTAPTTTEVSSTLPDSPGAWYFQLLCRMIKRRGFHFLWCTALHTGSHTFTHGQMSGYKRRFLTYLLIMYVSATLLLALNSWRTNSSQRWPKAETLWEASLWTRTQSKSPTQRMKQRVGEKGFTFRNPADVVFSGAVSCDETVKRLNFLSSNEYSACYMLLCQIQVWNGTRSWPFVRGFSHFFHLSLRLCISSVNRMKTCRSLTGMCACMWLLKP